MPLNLKKLSELGEKPEKPINLASKAKNLERERNFVNLENWRRKEQLNV